jgi:WD40-like Beta Propeller Repeat
LRQPEFLTASGDGSKALFTSRVPLTANANTGPPCGTGCIRSGNDLYEIELGPSGPGRLTDLTPDPGEESGANAVGVLGMSEAGSPYVYFVAKGVLAGADREGRSPTQGAENLYVTREGRTAFIATLSGRDGGAWSRSMVRRTSRVTPDGRRLLFMSRQSLTGYDNVDARTGARDTEVYLYDATTETLSCVSCNPAGTPPIGPSSIPAGTDITSVEALYDSRSLSADGSRVFFESEDSLVPQDTNGARDVYEYEAGRPYLISSGTATQGASFIDASASGNDVFFVTHERLVGQDVDEQVDLYDARVGGGFPSPPAPPPSCEGQQCALSISSPPVFGLPASAMLTAGEEVAPVAAKAKTGHRRHRRHHRRRRHSTPHRGRTHRGKRRG